MIATSNLNPDGRSTAIPLHRGEIIGAGLMSKILRDIEMTREEFIDLISNKLR